MTLTFKDRITGKVGTIEDVIEIDFCYMEEAPKTLTGWAVKILVVTHKAVYKLWEYRTELWELR